MSPFDDPDYHALIRQIREIDRAGGDSTLARLVTADWLEDRGEEERAEFVRLSVNAEVIRRGLKQPHQSSRWREAMGEWIGSVPVGIVAAWVPGMKHSWSHRGGAYHSHNNEMPAGGPRYAVANWAAGFVGRAVGPLSFWLAHGPDICRRHPVREVAITDRRPSQVRGGTARWQRRSDWDDDGEDLLPDSLFDRLQDCRDRPPGEFSWVGYDFIRQAEADLNVAALRWAEAEADAPVTSAAPSPPS